MSRGLQTVNISKKLEGRISENKMEHCIGFLLLLCSGPGTGYCLSTTDCFFWGISPKLIKLL